MNIVRNGTGKPYLHYMMPLVHLHLVGERYTTCLPYIVDIVKLSQALSIYESQIVLFDSIFAFNFLSLSINK